MTAALPDGIADQARAALAEDVGAGDCTAVVAAEQARSLARVIARETAVLAGKAWFDAVFAQVDASVNVTWHAQDGDRLNADNPVCDIEGPARALLTGERTALNFLQLLSGIATVTRRYVDRVKGTQAQILDTRKTLPNLRAAQKYAVLCGGGVNHRFGLYDGILIKENHIAAAGSLTEAVRLVRLHSPGLPVQVEVENLGELEQALQQDVDSVLLDNFKSHNLTRAVQMAGRYRMAHQAPILTEASGDISLANVREVADTGVHRISIGGLTKHITATDFSMRMQIN
jgi:nicotinate-nucleotide pyrophosphorylase (carboxylating)